MFSKISILALVIVILVVSFVVFFPKFYTSTDEKEYIENAYFLSNGDLVRQDAPCYFGAYCGYFNGDGWVSKYNIGWSMILLPFVLIDWKLSFVVTFAFFILGIYIFKKVLDHSKLSNYYLILYAFFPAFIYYSYKPLTETVSATLVLLLYYLLFLGLFKNTSKTGAWGNVASMILIGAICGILVLVRYTNFIIVFTLLAGFFLREVLSLKDTTESRSFYLNRVKLIFFKLGLIFLGSIPFVLIFFYANNTFYHGVFSSGYSLSGEEFLIKKEIVLKQILNYLLILNTIYPLMFLSLFRSTVRGNVEILLIAVSLLVFYAGFPGYHFESGILDFIFGARFFVPIMGLILLAYINVLDRVLMTFFKFFASKKRFVYALGYIFTVALVLNSLAIAYVYMKRTAELLEKSNNLYTNYDEHRIIETDDIQDRILVNEAFGKGERWVENPDWERYFVGED